MKNLVRKLLRKKIFAKIAAFIYSNISKSGKMYRDFCEFLLKTYPINTWRLSEKEKNALYREMTYCRYYWGASLVDYFLYEFYRCSEREIATFMTERKRVELYRYADSKQNQHFFGNKKDFYSVFNKFMSNECVFLDGKSSRADFDAFIRKFDRVVVKPIDGQRGIGVKIVCCATKEEKQKIWDYYQSSNVIVEKVINGCEELQEFHPRSLNTIRVSTATTRKGKTIIMAATLRTGTGENNVDNGHAGGVYAGINVENGIISSIGYNAMGYRFPVHPDSKKAFAGFSIPKWNELCELSKEVAGKISDMRYIGWDWALDENYNWILIEGNEPGGIDVHQHPTFTGLYEAYKRVLYSDDK